MKNLLLLLAVSANVFLIQFLRLRILSGFRKEFFLIRSFFLETININYNFDACFIVSFD
jgi:hypothetical protein